MVPDDRAALRSGGVPFRAPGPVPPIVSDMDSLMDMEEVSPEPHIASQAPLGPAPRCPRLPRVTTQIGRLTAEPARDRDDLLAAPVAKALAELAGRPGLAGTDPGGPWVAEIDPELADTAAFCERYEGPLAESANCVVVTGKRDGEPRY